MNLNKKQPPFLNGPSLIEATDELGVLENKECRSNMVKRLLKYKSKWKFETIAQNDQGNERDIYSVSLGDNIEYFSLLSDESDLGYYVKMAHINNFHPKVLPQTQASVWQCPTFRVAEDMFLNYYIPKFKVLTTEEYDIPRSERFWGALIYRALRKGYVVYFVNRENTNQIINILSLRYLQGLLNKPSINEYKCKKYIILISAIKIPELDT